MEVGASPAPTNMPPPNNQQPRSAARHAALQVLVKIEQEDAFLSAALEKISLPDGGRGFVQELTSGVQRHRALIDYNLAPLLRKPLPKLDAPVRAALRLAAYERAVLGTPAPAVGNEYANLMRRVRLSSAVAFINAIARRLPAALEHVPPPERSVEHLSVKHSHLAWLVERWLKRWGFEECRRLCEVNNSIAPLSLRVNTLQIARDEMLSTLLQRGLSARVSELAPAGIIVEDAGSPLDWPEWGEGQIIAQDEGAQLVALLAAPLPGQLVLDATAAPGGKTTHLAQLMNDQGRVIACDVAPGRLKLIASNAERLKLRCIETKAGDFREITTGLPSADLVLLDAPCLGTGTFRRRPDAKWRKTPAQLAELLNLQAQLLDAAASRVKAGGALIYSTCSLEPEENEIQIQTWLQENQEWYIDRATVEAGMPAGCIAPEGWITTLPHRDGCDGMFAARLRRL